MQNTQIVGCGCCEIVVKGKVLITAIQMIAF
jgi:hypothetical protein